MIEEAVIPLETEEILEMADITEEVSMEASEVVTEAASEVVSVAMIEEDLEVEEGDSVEVATMKITMFLTDTHLMKKLSVKVQLFLLLSLQLDMVITILDISLNNKRINNRTITKKLSQLCPSRKNDISISAKNPRTNGKNSFTKNSYSLTIRGLLLI
jgi:hypothetical protein